MKVHLPGYDLGTKLYESRNSVVHAATTSQGRAVVIKASSQSHPSAQHLARLRKEFALLSELGLPKTPTPVELLEFEGRPVAVYADDGGRSLMHLMISHLFDLEQQLEMAALAARVLQSVHEAGVIHKDISPGNLVFNPATGDLQIIDFGIATRLRSETADPADRRLVEGTLAYMAPEQTGRMNRATDSRSDLYALGATLFHLFTGRPPFLGDDQLELVHCHVARQPPRADELNSSVPSAVADVLNQLLAKVAEDRYQTAEALALDLEHCLQQARSTGDVQTFPLRTGRDSLLRLPQKLYGRDDERTALLNAFERVGAGGRELVVVSGRSGVGKTRLVQEVQPPVVAARGFFARGKFGQYVRNIPYSSLLQAFREVLWQILSESEARIATWRTRLDNALGGHGQLIVDVLPELELLLGEQPAVADLPPLESRNRFHRVFERFCRAFAAEEHPLVLFLDDLQWADQPSLHLMERFLLDPACTHLLIIAAYREEEVGEHHPLRVTLDELEEDGASLHQLRLGALTSADVREFVEDALGEHSPGTDALAALIWEKTDGNPFVLTRFLSHLHTEGLLHWDPALRRWTWNIGELRLADLGEGAEDLILRRIDQLSARRRQTLELAACIGATFDLLTLALVSNRSPKRLVADLWQAVELDLVAPIGEDYAVVEHDDADEAFEAKFRFVHDRVQQAAYSRLTAAERERVHFTVGNLLIDTLDEQALEERLFEVVGHLDVGTSEHADADTVRRLARLTLRAADKARTAAAYEPALAFFERGIELLRTDGWSEAPELMLALHVGAASSAYSAADFERMDARVGQVLAHSRDSQVRAQVQQTQLSAWIARNEPGRAVSTALAMLPTLGVSLPTEPTPDEIAGALGAVVTELGEDIGGVADLRDMTEPDALAAMAILQSISSAAYVAAPALFPLVAIKQVQLSLQHGVTPASAFALTTLGILYAGPLADLDGAFACAQTAEALLERFGGTTSVDGRTRYVCTAYLRIWKQPARDIRDMCPAVMERCLEGGDLEFASWAAMMKLKHGFFVGGHLPELHAEGARLLDSIGAMGQVTAHQYASITQQTIRNLLGRDGDPSRLEGDAYSAKAMLPLHEGQGDAFAIASVHFHQLILLALLGRWQEAEERAAAVAPRVGSFVGLFHVPLFHQYAALSALSVAMAEPHGQDARIAAAMAHRAALVDMAEHCPENHAHRVRWLDAELAAIHDDRRNEAAAAYDDAASLARTNGFAIDHALITERASEAWTRWGNTAIGRTYASEARYLWDRIGADTLVARLDDRWGRVALASRQGAVDTRVSASFTSTTERLDLRSVLKASQALSSELSTKPLLHKLMAICLENGGASAGALVISGSEGPRLVARARFGGEVMLVDHPLDDALELPTSVLQFVLRTGESVVLADATDDRRFPHDADLALGRAKSVLCTPLMRLGRVTGAVYLENQVTPGAFDSQRIEVLGVLASQAAISLENARLVETLEERVAERTAALDARNRFIREVFGRYVTNEIVDSLLSSSQGLSLGGELREITILMTDLRGFTAITQRLDPPQVVRLLNNYLGVMTEVVQRFGGTIDEVLGDAMLVLFGAPLARDDHADAAIACAMALQLAMDEVTAKNAADGLPEVELGIGLCTGEVVVGNIGSEHRAKYGVVGPAVNMAARIESMSVGGQVLVAQSTHDRAKSALRVDATHTAEPKGVREPVTVYEIGGIGAPYDLELQPDAQVLTPLTQPLGVQFNALKGKTQVQGDESGVLIALGERGALLRARPQPVLTDIRVRIAGVEGDLYAKVVATTEDSMHLRFTSQPAEVRAHLERHREQG